MSDRESYLRIQELLAVNDELQQQVEALEKAQRWIPIDDFETDAYEGWCWIVYKGRVTESYRDHNYRYLMSKFSQNCFQTECISEVMKWPHPEPPIEGKK